MPFLELSDSVLQFVSEGGYNTLGISSNQYWKFQNVPDWCVITDKSGNGSKTIRIEVSAYTDDIERKVEIQVVSGKLLQKFTILQKEFYTTKLSVSVSELIFSNNGEEKLVEIETDGKWKLTFPDWVVVSQQEGFGKATITVKTEANTSSEVKEGSMKITSGGFSREIKLYQENILPANTIEVVIAGNLKRELESSQLMNTDKLIILGELKAEDFSTLRSMPNLKYLDLEKVVIRQGYYHVGSDGWYWNLSPANELPMYSFDNCSKLETVVLPMSIDRIGRYAFQKCTGITSITIPDNVIETDECTFLECENLKNVVLSKQMKRISTQMFLKCKSLCQINIPENISEIGAGAFGSNGFVSITIPSSVKKIEAGIFSQCEKLENIVIPETVDEINTAHMFFRCRELKDVQLTEHTKELGTAVFWGCTSLTSIRLPEQVEKIGDQAFWECPGLTSLTFPASVNHFGEMAFGRSTSLKEIRVLNPTPPRLVYASFGTFGDFDTKNCTLYVPKGSKPAYLAKIPAGYYSITSWGAYFRDDRDNIVEME